MSHRMIWLLILMASSALFGCSSAPTIEEDEWVCVESDYLSWCRSWDFVELSASDLRRAGDEIEVFCPFHPEGPQLEIMMPECVDLVRSAILLVNEKHQGELAPIDVADVRFRDQVAFRSGDEDFYIMAIIPLRWLESEN